MSFSRSILCGAFLAGAMVASAHANTIYFANVGNDLGGGLSGASVAVGGDSPLAQSFTVTPGGVLELSNIGLVLNNGGNSGGVSSIVVTLNADLAGAPGSVLATLGTLADSALTSSSAVYNFWGQAYTLTSGATYWIEAQDTYAGSTASLATTAVWEQASGIASGDIGVENQHTLADGLVLSNGTIASAGSNPLQMSVDAPEPATLAVLGVGLAGIGWARRRRAASKAV